MSDVVDKKPEEIKSRKQRATGSMHIGDVDFDPDDPAFYMDATWGEVCRACCVHDVKGWAQIFGAICLVIFFLYFFLVGLDFMATGAQVMTGCSAGSLFGSGTNPLAGLLVAMLATALIQSSSTTTSMIVSLVGSNIISVEQGIYMVMGANIGTTITNTIVALGHLGDGDQLERAFAGATVHDMFNILSVCVLFPLELVSGYLFHLTSAMVKDFKGKDGEDWEGPIKKWVEPIGKLVLIENKAVAKTVAEGGNCDDFYPIECEDPSNPTTSTCERVGLIACDKSSDMCPAFFDVYADRSDDVMSGVVCFIIGIFMIFTCLLALVYVLQKLLLGVSTRIMYKATNLNPYVSILIGCGLTMLVQSSSVTTSAMVPLVGLGVLRLEQVYPLTLGANIGTTITAIMAAMLSDSKAMQVALAHTFFNITGIVIWFPIPYMRAVPLYLARQLGKGTRIWRGFPFVYIAVTFFVFPLILLGLSSMFMQDSKGLTVLAALITVFILLGLLYTAYYCRYQGGNQKCYECLVSRQTRRVTMQTLPQDMQYLKEKVKALSEHTGLEEDADEEDEEAPEAVPLVTMEDSTEEKEKVEDA